MVDKKNETIEVPFSGEMIEYSLVFINVKISDCGTGCDIQKNNTNYNRIEKRSC